MKNMTKMNKDMKPKPLKITPVIPEGAVKLTPFELEHCRLNHEDKLTKFESTASKKR